MTLVVGFPAFATSAGPRFAMLADRRQEYLPQLPASAGAGAGTDAILATSSAHRARNEMTFERLGPSCYLCRPFSDLPEQSASVGRTLDEGPAEDMHRPVSKTSQVDAEICEAAARFVASSSRELGHGHKADGMSAGG